LSEDSQRLRILYDLARRLATFTNLDDLLRFATRSARELFDAEGCALLLLDRRRNEFFFPIASQAEARRDSGARLAEVRFPADRGIAGWVLSHGQSHLVEDTSQDARFYDAVDRSTEMHTRSLLCAPLRTRAGPIGVIEVVNPAARCLSRDHLDFLDALASDIAVAHENAALSARLRGEVVSLRKICGLTGLGLLAGGALFGAAVVFTHLARALPLAELPSRPGTGMAAVLLAAGVGLVALGRGWIIPPTASSPPPR
jgi:GAF domain-containing protein